MDDGPAVTTCWPRACPSTSEVDRLSAEPPLNRESQFAGRVPFNGNVLLRTSGGR